MCIFFNQVDHTREYALVTEFSVIESLISPAIMKPEDPDDGETPVPNLSWLNIAHCKCNCSNYPERGPVLVNRDNSNIYNTAMVACSGNASDPTVDDSSEEDVVLHAERFKLRGSTFHNGFQLALKKCQQKWANKEEIACKLQVQPVNIKDENAIVAQAYLDERWQSLGYIPKEKIPKVTKAMMAEEVQEVKLEHVFRVFVGDCKQHKYIGHIVVIKRRRWDPDEKNYQYNDYILHP